MRYCNINIQDDTRRFKYIIEYKDNVEYQVLPDLHYSKKTFGDDLRVDFFEKSQIARNDNYWQEHVNRDVDPPLDNLTQYIPQENGVPKVNISSVNLYFPTNSVEAYTNNSIYALTINTWIHGHAVYLGTYIIDRRDALACSREMKFMNSRYFEYVNVKFIDPWYLTYSDEWKDFRQQVCGEEEGETELNNTGSVLNFTLYPVVWNEDRYIKLDPYIGGQNAINISDNVSDYIGCDLDMTQNKNSGEYELKASLRFNESYSNNGEQTIYDLNQYMKETYDIDGDLHLMYNLLVVDNENIYKVVSKDLDELECIFTRDDIYFDNWEGWKEGLRFILNVDVYAEERPVVDFVDLGLPLGTLWTKTNIGSTSGVNFFNPGLHFSWGETEFKPDRKYGPEQYKFGSNYPYSRYDYNGEHVLAPEDDAATVNLGPKYRTPTVAEFQELIDNTNNYWVSNFNKTGVDGWKFEKIGEPNIYIFLPVAGYYWYWYWDVPSASSSGSTGFSRFQHDYDTGKYWTSNLSLNYPTDTCARCLRINSEGASLISGERWEGYTVRPVYIGGQEDEKEREDIMLLHSNTISITQDIMKYFISIDGAPKTIDLKNVDMNNYTINAVNKIEKKIIQIDKPTDTKANLIKPVYFRVHELNSLIIHPAVTENICINLDAYKSTVDTFFIQIENATFVEYARNNAGVIFKIIGANLAGEVGSGTYYILNQDKELVTTGKFTYES